jgi:hypothetical protein
MNEFPSHTEQRVLAWSKLQLKTKRGTKDGMATGQEADQSDL